MKVNFDEIKNNVDSIETVDLQNKYKIEFEYLELFIEKFESLTSVDVEAVVNSTTLVAHSGKTIYSGIALSFEYDCEALSYL